MAKNKGGRPTVMTPEAILKLEQAFSVDATVLQACFFAGVSKSAFYEYLKSHPEFEDKIEALKGDLAFQAKNVLARSIREEGSQVDAKWYLERKEKNEFSTQVNNNNENSGEILLTINKVVHSASDRD